MTSDTIELVERVRQRLDRQESPVRIAGPVSEAAIAAAEEALDGGNVQSSASSEAAVADSGTGPAMRTGLS